MPVQKFTGSSLARVDEKGDGTFVPIFQLETGNPGATGTSEVIGQRSKKDAGVNTVTSGASYALGAVVANRAIGTIIGGMFAFQTAVTNGIVKITGVTFTTSNSNSVKAQVDAFAFSSATPSGTNIVHGATAGAQTNSASVNMAVTDNTALAIPQSLLGTPNLALLGGLTGASFVSANGATITSPGALSNIKTDANGKFYVIFALRGAYSNILNETITASAEWYD